jgi:NitT/TauT family transport system substrate-binding protein
MMKAISKLLIAIISIIIIAIAGIGAYLYFAYLQAPVQKPVIITDKKFTLGLVDPKSGLHAAGTAYVIENNYLQKYAPNIEIARIGGGSGAVIRAIETGQVHLGIVATLSAIVAIGKKSPITIIAGIKNPFLVGVFVRPDSGIDRLEQLKGKTLTATTVGSVTDVSAKILAARMGWTIGKDVNIVYVGATESEFVPVIAGKTDAIAVYLESGYPYLVKGAVKFIPAFNESAPGYVLIGHKDWIKQNPDAVKAVLKGLSEGYAAYMANKEVSINFIIKYYDKLNLNYDQAKRLFEVQKWYTNFVIAKNLFEQELKELQSIGLVPKDITVDMLYTPDFVPVVTATADQLYISLFNKVPILRNKEYIEFN